MTEIRPVSPEDDKVLIPMFSDLLLHHEKLLPDYYHRAENFEQELVRWLHAEITNPHTQTYLAFGDNEPGGFIHLMIRYWPAWYRTSQVGFISYAYVKPDLRGKGIGRALCETAEGWARDHGHEYLELYVDNLNNIGKSVWEKLGFKTTKQYMMKRV